MFAIPIPFVIPANDCMDAEGRITQEQLPTRESIQKSFDGLKRRDLKAKKLDPRVREDDDLKKRMTV